MTPSRRWLGIATPSWLKTQALLHVWLVGGRLRHARERRARRPGNAGVPRAGPLPAGCSHSRGPGRPATADASVPACPAAAGRPGHW